MTLEIAGARLNLPPTSVAQVASMTDETIPEQNVLNLAQAMKGAEGNTAIPSDEDMDKIMNNPNMTDYQKQEYLQRKMESLRTEPQGPITPGY